jgi:hypothetical protein
MKTKNALAKMLGKEERKQSHNREENVPNFGSESARPEARL